MRLSLAPVGSARVANCTLARMVTTIGIDATATSDPADGRAVDASRARHNVHTDAVITSTVSNHSQRTVYSKYGPKMRAIDTIASSQATPSNACSRNSDVARRDRATRTADAPQDEQADEPDDGDDAERVAARTEHPRPEQVELDDDDLGDVTEPEVRTVGVAEVVDQDRHVAG